MRVAIFVVAFLCFLPLKGIAEEPMREVTPDIREQVVNFFDYLSYVGNPNNKIDLVTVENYLAKDVLITSNNESICTSSQEFVEYIDRMQEKYAQVGYQTFLQEPIITENEAAIYFAVDCVTSSGLKRRLGAIALLSLHRGKIQRWIELVQEQ